MKRVLAFSLLLPLVACTGGDDSSVVGQAPTVVYRSTDRMIPFPSDRYLVEDDGASSTAEGGTGYRITITAPDDPALAHFPGIAEGLADMDGFGTSADIAVAFTSLPVLPEDLFDEATAFDASIENESPIRLIVVEPDADDPNAPAAGTAQPFVARLETDGRTVFLRPWRPLQPNTRYAVVIRHGLRDVNGHTYEAPEAFLRNYRSGSGEGLEGEGYRALRNVLAGEPLFALTFRTASIRSFLDDRLAELEAAPDGFTYTTTVPTRTDWSHTAYVVEGSFLHKNYRDSRGRMHATVQSEDRINITFTIPKGDGPFPVILGQHGLGDVRRAVQRQSDKLAEAGFATVAIDAPEHGDRITTTDRRPQLGTARDVLGVWTDGKHLTLKSWQFRDVIRQQALDHHQVIRLLQSLVLDFDGDGDNDLDASRLSYTGQSMGGIIGGVSGAVNTDLQRVLLNVPGGRLHNIVTQNETFGELAVTFMKPGAVSLSDVGRMFAMYQTVLDPGDPVNYVDAINNPPSGVEPRPLLIQAALGDATVPNYTTFDMARAARATLIGPWFAEAFDIVTLDPQAGAVKLPDVSFALFAHVRRNGAVHAADHGNVWASDSALQQAVPFFLDGIVNAPEVVTP